jgi:8-amino-7-oxononanoate synthase
MSDGAMSSGAMSGGKAAAADLVAGLRARRKARGADAASPTGAAPAAAPAAFDFGRLPASRELDLTAAAGALMGVQSPYYHRFDGPGDPVAEIEGRARINFCSYDYLGLNRHPDVLAAAQEAVARFGVSCSASRVVGGERPLHRLLEERLAAAYGVEDAVAMVSGHATNVTTIGCLVGPEDLVVCDELAHNSVIEGARLSGATRLMMPHNDLDWLERTLATARAGRKRCLIVVEGLYSMDGDTPDLARLVEIKNAFDAWLMVDEAHGLGVLGETGRGVAELKGVDPRAVEIWMGTLSKTLGSTGGYIAGSAALVRLLKAKAPGFVFSVGLANPLAAAAAEALAVMAREPERVARLRENGLALRSALRAQRLDTGLSEGFAVTPVVLGDSPTTAAVAHIAFENGLAAPPIMHPAVQERRARLRFFATSEHTRAQIEEAAAIVRAAVDEAATHTRRLVGG